MIENLLLCVGAQKTGTTWLHSQLKNHPDIGFSDVKEVHYFNTIHNGSILLTARKVEYIRKLIDKNRFALENYFTKLSQGLPVDKGIKKLLSPVDDSWYINHLKTDKKYSADFTPEYALLPDEGFENIKKISKKQKIIFIMRDPISRAKSAIQYYFQTHGLDISKSTEEMILEVSRKSFIVDMSRYQDTIEKIDNHFDADDVLYLFYEEVMRDKKNEMIAISKFLDVDFLVENDSSLEKKVNTSKSYMFSDNVEKYLREALSETYSYISNKRGSLPVGWQR